MAHKPTKELKKLPMSLGQIDVSSNVLKALLILEGNRNQTDEEKELYAAITKYLQSMDIINEDDESYTNYIFPEKINAIMEEHC